MSPHRRIRAHSGRLAVAAALLAIAASALAAPAAPAPRPVEAVPAQELSRVVAPPVPERVEGEEAPTRPRVGLVLSGGGARGLAHVGVIRALEELRVPIDCVTGTSMGAVVGALYALGLPADEIERAVLGLDWNDIFSDRPQRSDRSFRRKQDDRADLFDLELGLARGGVALPRGLIAGQKLAFALPVPELYLQYGRSFDDLPVPFRAVATDILTGEAIVLVGGDLVTAVRASMSVPGAFPPVEVEGRQLVDGGLTLNLPVDVARAMGADVVIAVDVARPLAEVAPEELRSLPGITRQSMALVLQRNSKDQIARADLVIRPLLGAMSSMSFGRAAWAQARGLDAARAAAAALAPYALPEPAWRERTQRLRRPALPPIPVDAVQIVNDSPLDDRVVRSRLDVAPTPALDLGRLRRGVDRIWELGLFESVAYSLRPDERANRLVVRAQQRPYGRNVLAFGLSFQDDLAGDSRFDLRARWTGYALNPLGGEWRLEGQLGASPRIGAEWYQPLAFSQGWFLSLGGEAGSWRRVLYAGDARSAEYRLQRHVVRAETGRTFGNFAEIRAGAVYGEESANSRIGAPDLSALSGRCGGWTARLAFDTLDDVSFPRHGAGGEMAWYRASRGLGAARPYDRLAVGLRGYARTGLNTGFLAFEGGGDLNSGLPAFDRFRLGGLMSLSGYDEGQLTGAVFGVARLGYWRALAPHFGALRPKPHLGAWIEAGNAWDRAADVRLRDLRGAATLALGAKTLLGPLYLAYGRTDAGRHAWYLTLGKKPTALR